jgi:tetratricopeptide (TPR) repeat protein
MEGRARYMNLSPRALVPTFAERKPAAVVIIGAILVLATLAIYLPAVQMMFISFDDPDYVWRNPRVVGGLRWDSVWWSVSHSFASNWHPLTWVSHMLDFQLYGMNAGGHHATNVIFHTVNTLLLFVLLREMTGALWRSALVAALFALHPLHVESVAWVAERKDVLSAFFGLLTLLAYAKYAVKARDVEEAKSEVRNSKCETNSKNKIRRGRFYYVATLGLFALGLMSKPMLVTLPCVMLLVDFWPLKRGVSVEGRGGADLRSLVVEKLPFFVLSLISCVVTFLAQSSSGATRSLGTVPLGDRIGNAVVSYARYLGKMIWPTQLSIVYPYQEWSAVQIGMAALILVVISWLVILSWRERYYLSVGWLWFLGMLVPVIGLVQVGSQAMADRYMYLPSIGLLVIIAWGAAEIAVGWSKQALIVGAAVVAIGACVLITQGQMSYWQNSEILFRHALAVTMNNYIAYNNLGFHYAELGELNQAKECYQAATQINPRSQHAWGDLAVVLGRQKRTAEAIETYEKALAVAPNFAAAHVNLANMLIFQGRTNEAVTHLEEAIRINPNKAEAHQSLAAILAESKEYNRAEQHFRATLRLNPYNPYVHSDFARLLVQQERLDEAAAEFKVAIELEPRLRAAVYGLADLLMARGEVDGAVQQYSDVLKIAPDDPEANYRYAQALTRQGNVKKAVEHYRRGLRKVEDVPEALNNLAWILATNPDGEVRNGADAVKFAEKACQLTDYKKAVFVGTLAAAYAEANRFSEAIEAAEKARLLAEAAKDSEIAARNAKLMELYRAQKPCRDVP